MFRCQLLKITSFVEYKYNLKITQPFQFQKFYFEKLNIFNYQCLFKIGECMLHLA